MGFGESLGVFYEKPGLSSWLAGDSLSSRTSHAMHI